MTFRRSSKFIFLALPLTVESMARADFQFTAPASFAVDSGGRRNSQNIQPAAATSATWNSDADGSWSNPTNWSAPVPDAIDASATFGSAITTPRVVTVDSPEVVGSISFNNANRYTIGGPQTLVLASSANQASISATAGSHTISAPLLMASDTTFNSNSGTLTISGAVSSTDRVITTQGTGTVEFANVRAKTLKINTGTTRIMPSGGSTGVSSLGAMTIQFGSGLDLTNNDLRLTIAQLQDVSLLINNGNRGFGGPTSPGAIYSSTVRSDPSHHLALGAISGAEFKSFGGRTTFDGLPIKDADVLVKYTIAGDTNFDGTVNALDFNAVAANFGKSKKDWSTGDLNDDAFVNTSDYTMLAQNFGQSVASPCAPAIESVVPEPNWAGVLSCVGIMALVKRRRTIPPRRPL